MIKLHSNKVAIIPIENPEKIGHIIIPDQAKDRLNQGFVKYKGADVQHLKIGDYVFFSGYTGTLTYIEGEGKFIIMPEDFCVAVLSFPATGFDIPGLYFKDRHGEHFNASYELAMQYITQAFSENLEWRDQVRVKNQFHEGDGFDNVRKEKGEL